MQTPSTESQPLQPRPGAKFMALLKKSVILTILNTIMLFALVISVSILAGMLQKQQIPHGWIVEMDLISAAGVIAYSFISSEIGLARIIEGITFAGLVGAASRAIALPLNQIFTVIGLSPSVIQDKLNSASFWGILLLALAIDIVYLLPAWFIALALRSYRWNKRGYAYLSVAYLLAFLIYGQISPAGGDEFINGAQSSVVGLILLLCYFVIGIMSNQKKPAL